MYIYINKQTVMIIATLVLIYLVSAYISWKDVSTNHSKGGMFERQDTDWADVFFTVTPVANTVVAFLIISGSILDSFPDFSANKFFKVKK